MEFVIIAGNALAFPAGMVFGLGCVFAAVFWIFWTITRAVEGEQEWHTGLQPSAKRLTIWWGIALLVLCPLPIIRNGIVQSRKDLMLIRYTSPEKVDELEGIAKQAILAAIEELSSGEDK